MPANGSLDTYTQSGTPQYVAYQFYRYSRFGPDDNIRLTDGSFDVSTYPYTYNNDGSYYWSANDRQLENKILLVPGNKITYLAVQRRAPNESQGFYAEDVRPFGFRVIKAIPNGFSFTVKQNSQTASAIDYSFTVVDPSLTSIGPATYQWQFTDYQGNVTTLAGQTVSYDALKDQPVKIQLTRTRNGQSQTIDMTDAGNNLARDNGNQFVTNLVPPAPAAAASTPLTATAQAAAAPLEPANPSDTTQGNRSPTSSEQNLSSSPQAALLAAYWQSLNGESVDALAAAGDPGAFSSASGEQLWPWPRSQQGFLTGEGGSKKDVAGHDFM